MMNNFLLACGLIALSSCAMTIQNDEMVHPDMEEAEDCIRGCTEVAEGCLEESNCDQRSKECLDVDIKCVAKCVEAFQ